MSSKDSPLKLNETFGIDGAPTLSISSYWAEGEHVVTIAVRDPRTHKVLAFSVKGQEARYFFWRVNQMLNVHDPVFTVGGQS